MKITAIFLSGPILNLLFLGESNAALIAEYDPGASPYNAALGIASSQFTRGQSFLATTTASVEYVSALLNRFEEATVGDSVTLTIRNGANFTDPVLGQQAVTGMTIPIGSSSDGTGATFVVFDFSSTNITLTSGSMYSIWFERTGALEYGWWGTNTIDGGAYSSGAAFTYLPNTSTQLTIPEFDLGFRVTSVPETSSVGFLIIGCITLALRRNKPSAEQFAAEQPSTSVSIS